MKTVKNFLIILFTAGFCTFTLACISSDNSEPQEKPKIVYHSNDRNWDSKVQYIEPGSPITLMPNEFTREGYIFLGWSIFSIGDIQYVDGQSENLDIIYEIFNSGDLIVALYAIWDFVFLYELGDTGPGGGIIFYRSSIGFNMFGYNTINHYLEAALEDVGELPWASYSGDGAFVDGFPDAIGMGRYNTALILERDPESPAANACKDYRGGGKDDWFFPSMWELNELYEQKNLIGGFSNTFYWSSSLFMINNAWFIDFNDGERISDLFGLIIPRRVRPIRAF